MMKEAHYVFKLILVKFPIYVELSEAPSSSKKLVLLNAFGQISTIESPQ